MISVSIIVPVFNEEKTIKNILLKIHNIRSFGDIQVVLVNDGSTDKTKKIIQDNSKLYDKFIDLPLNKGKGKAIIEGIKNSNKEYIFFQDADLEYSPLDLKNFIFIVEEFKADFIMGSRFISENRSILHFWHKIGNQFISFLFNILNNMTFSDIYCCHCLFKRKNLPFEKLKFFGWGQQAEILTYLVNSSSKTFETAVSYDARKYEDGKKIKFYHIFEVLYALISTRIKLFFN